MSLETKPAGPEKNPCNDMAKQLQRRDAEREELKSALVIFPNGGRIGSFLNADIAKRRTYCVICRRAIPKGTKRLTLTSVIPGGKTLPNGGWFNRRKARMHADCLVNAIATEEAETDRSTRRLRECLDCGVVQAGEAQPFWAFGGGGRNGELRKLCDRCADSPRWNGCKWCGIQYPRYLVGTIIIDRYNGPSNETVCDFCCLDRQLPTARQRIAAANEIARIDRQFAALQRGLERAQG